MRRALAGVLGLALASSTWAAAQDDGGDAAEAVATRRIIAVVHTRDDRGRVFCALWRGREGYPTRRQHAVGQAMDRTVVNRRGVCIFDDVTPGEYAIAVFHDENANNDLDRNIFGIPSEGTGASNDAHNMFGPPGYDDARFEYPSDTDELRLDIHIHY